jgi:hypothetical protein
MKFWGHAAADRMVGPPRERSLARGLLLLGVLQAPLKPLDLARRIDETLFAREEGVALRADVDVQVFLRRAGLPRTAATTRDGGHFVLGMDARFHFR